MGSTAVPNLPFAGWLLYTRELHIKVGTAGCWVPKRSQREQQLYIADTKTGGKWVNGAELSMCQ
jgi:hypothetical protein